MEVVFRQGEDNLIWKILHEAQELDPQDILAHKKSYIFHSTIKASDVSGSFLTLHCLFENTYPPSNLFCLFDKFKADVAAEHSLMFCRSSIHRAIFSCHENIIVVVSPKGCLSFDPSDPDTFSGLQASLLH